MPLVSDGARTLYASLMVAAILIAGLVLGRELLVPLSIAVILAFVLSPIVNGLTSHGLPRAIAVVSLLLALLVSLGAVSSVVSRQLLALAGDLGTYKHNVLEKVRAVAGATRSDGVLKRASDAIEALEKDVKREIAPNARAPDADRSAPERTVIAGEKQGISIWDYIGAAGHQLAQTGLTFLFTLFMLLQTQDLRDRIVRLAGTDNLSGTTAALGDAAERLSRLFLTQALLNVGFGVAIGAALWVIDVPNAALWGGLSILMRFVPYVGSLIAAIPPVLIAAAVDPGWGMALATLSIFAIGEPLMGHVVEPFVLGASAGLSPFAMLLSASFWATIWGPIGLILAAPITLTFVILGRYVGGLEFMTVMLGDEPALASEEKLYHRLLSGDTLAATQQLEDGIDEADLVRASDDILIPALRMAARDHDHGRIDAARTAEVRETAREALAQSAQASSPPTRVENGGTRKTILVVPARSQLDGAVADLLAHASGDLGMVEIHSTGSQSGLTALSQAAAGPTIPAAVVLTSAGESDAQYLPLIVRRARRNFPSAQIYIFDIGRTHAMDRTSDDAKDQAALTFDRLGELLSHIAHATQSGRGRETRVRSAEVQ